MSRFKYICFANRRTLNNPACMGITRKKIESNLHTFRLVIKAYKGIEYSMIYVYLKKKIRRRAIYSNS